MIRIGSVCSGIDAASVAAASLGRIGAKVSWLSEIDGFPCGLLAHRYPSVPNLGDMTLLPELLESMAAEAPEIVVGGTPCQAFSLAGKRAGLADARGNLSLTFCEIANANDRARQAIGHRPSVIVWENVPGVLSSKDNAFGCFLAGLAGEDDPLVPPGKKWTNAGFVLGPERTVAWRVLDAQYFGVAQRRRRVWVVASAPSSGVDPREILFEREGVRRDTPPRREGGEAPAGAAPRGTGGAVGTDLYNRAVTGDVAATIGTSGSSVSASGPTVLELTAPIVLMDQGGSSIGTEAGIAGTLRAQTHGHEPAVLEAWPINTMTVMGRPSDGGKLGSGIGNPGEPQNTISKAHSRAVFHGGCVRRLLPVECERLQGFPDGYTDVPGSSDTSRYKALGNSWAVPNARWVLRRVAAAIMGGAK